jgi:hypothetical protein
MCILVWKHKKTHLFLYSSWHGIKKQGIWVKSSNCFLLHIELQQHRGKTIGDWTLKHLGQANSKGDVMLFSMSKKNLNPSYWRIWHTKNHKKGMELRKFWSPKVKRVNNSKKKTIECYKGRFLNTQTLPCMLFYWH